MPLSEKTYTTFQIAEICNVAPTTVIQWANQGKIKSYTTPGRHRRIYHSELLRFLKRYNMPIPSYLSPKRRRILIVEDEKDIATLLIRAFEKYSDIVEVQWKKDGVEALLVLGRTPPDLVVLDVVMPVVDGSHVLATLRHSEQTKGVAVIGMTGKRLPPEKLRFMQQNTDAFYYKPFKVADLVLKAMDILNLPAEGEYVKKEKSVGHGATV